MIPLAIDLSEFLCNPISTGIQRVVRQLVRYWPKHVTATYVLYAKAIGGFVEVAPRMLARFMAIDNRLSHEDVRKVASLLIASMPIRRIPTSEIREILIPEVFFDKSRVDFYRRIILDGTIKISMIVYDFKPFTNPAVFRVDLEKAVGILPYLSLTRLVQRRTFISAQTADDFHSRISRSLSPQDSIIPLGADGISLEKQKYDSKRKDLLCIGTFEGKKHQEIVFKAFRNVSEKLSGMRLVFAGYVPKDLAHWLRDVVTYQGDDVLIVKAPTDQELAGCFRTAAATIFVSTNEGFGLPAIESLYLGVPVIAFNRLPSIEKLNAKGQIRVSMVDVPNVQSALLEVADPDQLNRLWAEASLQSLPTWEEYALRVAAWVADVR